MASGVMLRERVDKGADELYETDSEMLVQILTNLMQNGARHTRAGFVEVHARSIAASPSGASVAGSTSTSVVELTVSDSGLGMSESTARSCFDKYTTSGGVGLGLYLVRLQVLASTSTFIPYLGIALAVDLLVPG